MTVAWSLTDNSGLTLSNSNLTATNAVGTASYVGCRASSGFAIGNQVYAEFTFSSGSTSSATYLSVLPATFPMTVTVPGASGTNSFGFHRTGVASYNGTNTTLTAFVPGDIISFAVDTNNKKVWVRVNNGGWNNDTLANQNPTANVGGIYCPNLFVPGYVYFGVHIRTANHAVTANFDGPFTQSVPSGYAWMPPITPGQVFGVSSATLLGLAVVRIRESAVGQSASTGAGLLIGTTSLLPGAFAVGQAAGTAEESISASFPSASAMCGAGFTFPITATTIYNLDGFDHLADDGLDLLRATANALHNCVGKLSTETPYGNGHSLAVEVTGLSSPEYGYLVYNSGPHNLPSATLSVVTQSSRYTELGTDIGFLHDLTPQMFCRLIGSSILIYQGAPDNPTLLRTIRNALPAVGWFHLEIQADIAVSGSVGVRVNGVQMGNFTGINTAGAGISSLNAVLLGGVSPSGRTTRYLFDDVCLSLSSPGEARVATLRPTGNGAQSEFLTTAASNWQAITDTTHDADQSYNFSSNVGNTDLFVIDDVDASINSVVAVKLSLAAKSSGNEERVLRSVLTSGSTTTPGLPYKVGSDYRYIYDIYPKNPDTASAWSPSTVNTLQIGYKLSPDEDITL